MMVSLDPLVHSDLHTKSQSHLMTICQIGHHYSVSNLYLF